MKGFFDYSKNEIPEEPVRGSSKIIIGKPNIGDKFVLVQESFGLPAGTIVSVVESTTESQHTFKLGFGLSTVLVGTPIGVVSLQGSTKLIQECFDSYKEPEILKPTPNVVVVNKTITKRIVEEGTPGQRGARGQDGYQGMPGTDGTRGEKGDTGEVGPAGPIGPQGERGEIGPQGERGETGVAGVNGTDGKNGIDGINGKDGKNGKKGEPGPQGLKGDRGIPGSDGSAGPTGATGREGKKGSTGSKGAAGKPGKDGANGIAGVKGDKGDTGEPGSSGVISASYPIVYDEKKKSLSFDYTKIEKLIQNISAAKGSIDLSAIGGGGAVGIQFNKEQVIKSVNDINFTGSGVNVIRKGKNVEIQISGVTTSSSSGITGPYVQSINGITGPISLYGLAGITSQISGKTYSFGINYLNGGTAFGSVKNPDSADKILLQQPFTGVMYLSDIKGIGYATSGVTNKVTKLTSEYFTIFTDTGSSEIIEEAISFSDLKTILKGISFTYNVSAPMGATIGDRWMDSDNGIEYVYVNDGTSNQWVQPTSSGLIGATGAQGIQGIQGVTGATGPVGDYVVSVNGQTGAVEYIVDFKRGWFLS